MLFRLFFLINFVLGFVYAKEQIQKVEILAKTLDKNGTIVHAKDDVVLYSNKYIITSDEAYYDYNTSDLELIGNITIMEGTTFSTRSGHAKLNMNNDNGNLTPMFAYTGESKIWLKCNNAEFDARYYLTKKSILSSCNVQNPDWKIGFTSGEYDRQEQFIHTYNTLFYVADVPIFYLPYFSFPTDRTRRTGLLRPEFSFGSDEGFYYLQPIYFAPQMNWDFQFNPQIRTNRGVGIHGVLRFVDSLYSYGEVSFGDFEEKSSYVKDNDLKNDKHYGYSIMYERSKLFSEYFGKNIEDGLWVDINYLNDIDYLNTIDNSEKSYDALVQSTLNYYMKRDLDYFGLYAKYYIDTSKDNNDDTIQELPTVQYHRFTNSILEDNIFYSIDYKGTNYTSKAKLDSFSNEINIPISIYFSFLDDILHFKATENFYLANVDYDDGEGTSGGGNIVQNYHRLSLYSELAKPYEDFLHTMSLVADYTIPGTSRTSDGFDKMLEDTDLQELDSLVINTKENISLSLVEFFYDKSGKKLLSHTLRQSILMGDLAINEYRYQDLSNNIHIYFSDNLTLSNLLNYSHEFSRFSKFQTSLNWKIDKYTTKFIHTYQKDSNDEVDNYLTFAVDTHYVKNYNLFASMNYDIQNDFFKSWQVGWTMKKKCWDYRIAYREEIEPNSSTVGSINKRGIYLTFNLYPIGGISYDFTKENRNAN
jgi:LPS-assembly protein